MFTLFIRNERNRKGSILAKNIAESIGGQIVQIVDLNQLQNIPSYISGTPFLIENESNKYMIGSDVIETLKNIKESVEQSSRMPTTPQQNPSIENGPAPLVDINNKYSKLASVDGSLFKDNDVLYQGTGKISVSNADQLAQYYLQNRKPPDQGSKPSEAEIKKREEKLLLDSQDNVNLDDSNMVSRYQELLKLYDNNHVGPMEQIQNVEKK